MCTRNKVISAILTAAILLLVASPARSATEAEITAAINNGITWLLADQNPNGSWGDYAYVGVTGLAVVKLQDRARELGTTEYDDEIQDGLNYIFLNAAVDPAGWISWGDWEETYQTGIAMMAIANDGLLSQTVGALGSPLDGMTYGQVLDGCVNYFMMNQNANGGWGYEAGSPDWSDQSNTGYATLGLSYARDAGASIPASIVTGLNNWIGIIQNPTDGDPDDGGSGYSNAYDWVNELKTGNLIFQMSFLGIGPGDPRFDAAIAYIERHWQDASIDPGWGYSVQPHYQAMYCLMKGLASSGVDLINTDGDPALEDWFNQEPPAVPAQDFASNIVATQQAGGSWPNDYWGDYHLATCWALLTLEKVTPIHYEFAIDIKPGSCPNPFNGKSEGSVPVAIIGAEGLDVTTIDPTSLELEGVHIVPGNVLIADVTQPGDYDPTDCSDCFDEDDYLTDTDGDGVPDTYLGDGFLDLVVKFDAKALAAEIGPRDRNACVVLTLTGETLAGLTFEASDSMIIRTKIK